MKLAIFDIDGTLVDSRTMITASLSAAFASESLPAPDTRTMLSIVGLSLLDAMKKLVPDGEPARHERMAAAYKRAFWQNRASGTYSENLFRGARELLEELRARDDVLLGIATGKSRRGIAHLLSAQGFETWFATLQTSDDHPSKPHPSMVRAALQETGAAPAETILIGDTSFDIGMARAAGVGAIGVTWGNHSKDELAAAGAHKIVNDFNELRRALDSLWQERAA